MSSTPSRPRWHLLLILAMIALLIAEVGLRILFYPDFLFWDLRASDASWQRMAWARRARDPKRTFTYSFDAYDPRRGWGVQRGIRNMRVFDTETLSTNSRGLRGVAEYPYDRVPGKRRIVVVGDSYTFGDEVSDNDTYSKQLERLLPNSEVLNFGVHGYGHDQMLVYLADEAIRYRPDVVLIGNVWFDRNRNLFSFNNYAKPWFSLDAGKLQLHGVPVAPPATEMAHEKYFPRVLYLVDMVSQRLRWRSGTNDHRAHELTAAIMDSMVVVARDAGAVPVIVYLPVLKELVDSSTTLSDEEGALNDYCSSRRVRCAFLRPRFTAAVKNGLVPETRRHWRAIEHRIGAEALRDYLIAEGLDRSALKPTGR